MDIDDILASVDRDDFSSPEATALDHQQLTRFWVTERAAPEVLPWPGPLMERTMERVRRQIEKIEDLTSSGLDPTIPNTTTTGNSSTNPSLNLTLSILQSDLSRTQYLIRSILRQRLAKLTKHSLYYILLAAPPPSNNTNNNNSQNAGGGAAPYLSTPSSSSANPSSSINATTSASCAATRTAKEPTLLSPSEQKFLHAHQSLLSSHYLHSFLSSFPPQLRRLDDNAGGTSMVQGPEAKEVVFVRCLAEEVRVVVPGDEGTGREEGYGRTLRRGEIWVVRWEGVREAWKRGDVEVL